MVKSFKTNLLTWLKTKTYIKTEIDNFLNGKSDTNHTHTNASTTTPGFLSAEDKTKLNNLEQITVDSTINATSTNPVQNKVINTALTGKANTNHTHSITNITNLQSQLDGKAKVQHNHTFATVINLQSTLNSKSDVGHTHDDRYYTEAEIDTKLDNKADSSHSHSINDVTGLSTSLDGKMGNNYKVSAVTGADNMYAHRIGDIVILSWWGRSVSTTNNWADWKILPYTSANTQHIWTSVDSTDTSVQVRIPPNSDKIQINVSGNGNIGAGFIVYPTK